MNSFEPTPEFGIETVSRNYKMPSMHYHSAYELYYLEAGCRDYFVGDKLFSVSAGDFVLIKPGVLHRTGGAYCVRTLVHFTDAFLQSIFRTDAAVRLVRCFDSIKIVPSTEQHNHLVNLLKRLAKIDDRTEFVLVLAQLLLELEQCIKEEISQDQVGSIVAYINRNYADIKTLDQIASYFFISKYHLCRIFKSAMQMTIVDYLNQIRIKNARQLLELSDQDMGNIAELCGFSSISYFSAVFKKSIGISPTRYRKEHKRNESVCSK